MKESAGKKEEIHKYTRILFTGTNSWLKFVTSQNDGEFFLDDLTEMRYFATLTMLHGNL